MLTAAAAAHFTQHPLHDPDWPGLLCLRQQYSRISFCLLSSDTLTGASWSLLVPGTGTPPVSAVAVQSLPVNLLPHDPFPFLALISLETTPQPCFSEQGCAVAFLFLVSPLSWIWVTGRVRQGGCDFPVVLPLGLILAALGAPCDGCPAPPAALLDLVGLVAPGFHFAET